MKYATLTSADLAALRAERLRELEVTHYRLHLEQLEEPLRENMERQRAMDDISRRIAEYQAGLSPTERNEDEKENAQTSASES